MLPRSSVVAALIATGHASALLAQALPPAYPPMQNPITSEKVMLGKFLFWEEQLSSNDSTACGTCHLPEFGGSDGRLAVHHGPDLVFGTDDDIRGSLGVARQQANASFTPTSFGLRRQVTRRTAPTNIGAGHHNALFWDLRATTEFIDPETGFIEIPFNGALESQSLGPILDKHEMSFVDRTWQDVRDKLAQVEPLKLARNLPADMAAAKQQNPSYPSLFQAAFGDTAISAKRIAFALASYQRVLNPDQTPYDAYVTGNPAAMNPTEVQGYDIFVNQGRCVSCHWEPLFSDDLPHNLGLRWSSEDQGVFGTTQQLDDVGSFKTPTLRNAGLRPRLFHNGQSPPLGDPAQFTDPASTQNVYLQGHGVDTGNLDPFMLPLASAGVSANEVHLAQEFVRTALTDPRVQYALPPFDHPDLRGLDATPPRAFGPALAGAREPYLADSLPAYPGNLDFRLGLAGGDGAGLAVLTYGFASFEPNLTVAGLPWHVLVHDWLPFGLAGNPAQLGHATWHLPIPDVPALTTIPFYFQLLVADPQAPGGIASSSGLELRIEY